MSLLRVLGAKQTGQDKTRWKKEKRKGLLESDSNFSVRTPQVSPVLPPSDFAKVIAPRENDIFAILIKQTPSARELALSLAEPTLNLCRVNRMHTKTT
jgi:hypothetical protein